MLIWKPSEVQKKTSLVKYGLGHRLVRSELCFSCSRNKAFINESTYKKKKTSTYLDRRDAEVHFYSSSFIFSALKNVKERNMIKTIKILIQ